MTFTKERSVADTTGMVYLLPKPKLIYDTQNPLFLVNVLVFPQTHGLVFCFVFHGESITLFFLLIFWGLKSRCPSANHPQCSGTVT